MRDIGIACAVCTDADPTLFEVTKFFLVNFSSVDRFFAQTIRASYRS